MSKSKTSFLVTNKDGSLLTSKYTMEVSWRVRETIFRAYPDGYTGNECFEITVSACKDGSLRVLNMNNHLPQEYREIQIGAALLQEIARKLEKPVCLNVSISKQLGENLTDEELSSWKHLIESGLAKVDKENDTYWLKNTP